MTQRNQFNPEHWLSNTMSLEQTLSTPSLDVLRLDVLCSRLQESANKLDAYETWPTEQLSWCAEAGVFRWFIDEEHGGWNWTDAAIIEGYFALSQSCLTTAFHSDTMECCLSPHCNEHQSGAPRKTLTTVGNRRFVCDSRYQPLEYKSTTRDTPCPVGSAPTGWQLCVERL